MDLQQKQIQTRQLNLQQMQSLTLLQFNALEIESYLRELSLENPVIEFSYSQDGRAEDTDIPIDAIKWIAEVDRPSLTGRSGSWDQTKLIESLSVDGGLMETLLTSVRRQVEQLRIEERIKHAACYLAACLDEDGYLRTPLCEIADETGIRIDYLRQGNKVLRSLNPAGIGARDLSDCLVLQLQRSGKSPVAIRIAQQYLEELSRGRLKEIAKTLRVSMNEVSAARETIRSLTPCPGEQFASWPHTYYLWPDVIVERRDDTFSARLAKESGVLFFISPTYLKMLEETDDPEVQAYLKKKIRQAKMIRSGILQREKSILGCANIIVKAQKAFFSHGEAYLSPLSMDTAAAAMGVHPSTAYRIVKGKYVQCAFGIFPMGYFFAREAVRNGNMAYSAAALKAVLKRLIDENEPMSDRQLSEKMAERGYSLSRRTITKYRTQLGIQNSYQRKR